VIHEYELLAVERWLRNDIGRPLEWDPELLDQVEALLSAFGEDGCLELLASSQGYPWTSAAAEQLIQRIWKAAFRQAYQGITDYASAEATRLIKVAEANMISGGERRTRLTDRHNQVLAAARMLSLQDDLDNRYTAGKIARHLEKIGKAMTSSNVRRAIKEIQARSQPRIRQPPESNGF
jgi:hypothetical protein